MYQNHASRAWIIGLCLAGSLRVAGGDTFYVDAGAADDGGAGTNWDTAKKTIQAAVDLAGAGDQVLVTNGIYDAGGVVFNPLEGLVTLTNRVAVTNAITLLAASADPADTLIVGVAHESSNGPAAIRCVYLADGAVLSGFTLTNGHTTTNGSITNTYGGGVFCRSTNALITNCIMADCSAQAYGGGASRGTLRNCTLLRNQAILGGGGGAYGGNVAGCNFISNTAFTTAAADANGGGAASATLTDCLLQYNRADRFGGAYNCQLRNCVIEFNVGTGRSGGIGGSGGWAESCIIRDNSGQYGGGAGFTFLTNCLVVNNTGKYAGACDGCTLYQCTIVSNRYASLLYPAGIRNSIVVNCIIVSNYTAGVLSNYSASVFTNSCTYPLPEGGAGNITNEPGFVDYDARDFHLVKDSPCINAGLDLGFAGVTNDLDGLRRPMYRAYDMGCYENLPPAIMLMILK